MAIKVVVVVTGGIVQDCYADREDVQIEMIDFDNFEEQGVAATNEAQERAKEVERTMYHIY